MADRHNNHLLLRHHWEPLISHNSRFGSTSKAAILHKYRIEEAIYNHFSRDIWESFSRKQVDAKFKYAIQEVAKLIQEGKMEVRKAKDVFGKDAFRNHLNAAYEKDLLIGGKKYFSPNDYYFFPLDGSSAGALKGIQEAIKKMGR